MIVAVPTGSDVCVAAAVGAIVPAAGDPHEMINIEITDNKNERTILDLIQNSSFLIELRFLLHTKLDLGHVGLVVKAQRLLGIVIQLALRTLDLVSIGLHPGIQRVIGQV